MNHYRIITLCVLLVLTWTSLGIQADGARAYVDRNPVRFGETLRLVIEFDGGVDGREFDSAPLDKDFDVLGTSTSSQINIVNGRQEANGQLLIELEPRREGDLVVPSLKVGGNTTDAIRLKVLPADSQALGKAREVFLEVSVLPDSPYVQASVTLSIKLFLSVALVDGNMSDPDILNADIHRLGDDTQYATTRDGVRYQVVERRFVVFPQRSGKLAIPTVLFEGRAADNNSRSSFGGLFRQGRRVRGRSAPLELDVRPPPKDFTGATWLPAREVKLTESWPDDPPVFVVGKPVTRTLRVEAQAISGLQIPALDIVEVEDVRHYPDKPEIQTAMRGEELLGIREQRIAMVPSRPGLLTLPEVELSWWDIDEDRQKTARIPSRTISIIADPDAKPVTPVELETVSSVDDTASRPIAAKGGWWRILTVFFALIWLATLWLWWRQGVSAKSAAHSAFVQPQKPGLTGIATACRHNDPVAARRAILTWANRKWPTKAPKGLEHVAAVLEAGQAISLLRDLDRACYGDSVSEWNGELFWKGLKPMLKNAREVPVRKQSDLLPGLYPEC